MVPSKTKDLTEQVRGHDVCCLWAVTQCSEAQPIITSRFVGSGSVVFGRCSCETGRCKASEYVPEGCAVADSLEIFDCTCSRCLVAMIDGRHVAGIMKHDAIATSSVRARRWVSEKSLSSRSARQDGFHSETCIAGLISVSFQMQFAGTGGSFCILMCKHS